MLRKKHRGSRNVKGKRWKLTMGSKKGHQLTVGVAFRTNLRLGDGGRGQSPTQQQSTGGGGGKGKRG